MKKVLIAAIIIIIAGGVWFSFGRTEKVMGEQIELIAYTADGENLGGGVISLPFIKDLTADEMRYASMALDLNRNGEFEATEWIVQNSPARIYKDYRNNFPIDLNAVNLDDSSPLLALAVLTKSPSEQSPEDNATEKVETQVIFKYHELAEILGFNVPGASEDLKRGPAPVFSLQIPQAFAQGGEINASRDANIPDLPQGPMECSAVATANNLISLAGEHGQLDKLPQNARDLVNELKADMQFNNGIVNSNFKAGKDAFVARHNLPIVTRRITNPTFADLTTALNSGGAVELSTRMIQSASGQASTGHTMTLVGANQSATGSQSVQVHDSASPSGADTLNLGKAQTPSGQEFLVVNYPLWDGVVIVDDIFVQNWTEPEHADTGSQTDLGEEMSRIEVLVIGGSYYPKSQFRISRQDACDSDHYHGGTVYGLRNKTSNQIISINDPAPTNCGFGRVAEVPVELIDITLDQSTELIKNIPL